MTVGCESEYNDINKRIKEKAVISLVHGNTYGLKQMHPREYISIRTKDLLRKVMKPGWESNLYLPITGRLFNR